MWSWHILHPKAVTNGLVNNTKGMFWSNRGLYSNKSTDLAEISASLCVVELLHNRIPPSVCSYTWYYQDGQKAVRYCITPEGSLWQPDLDRRQPLATVVGSK